MPGRSPAASSHLNGSFTQEALLPQVRGAQFSRYLIGNNGRLRLLALAASAVAAARHEQGQTLLALAMTTVGMSSSSDQPERSKSSPVVIRRYEDYEGLLETWAARSKYAFQRAQVVLEVRLTNGSVRQEIIQVPRRVMGDQLNVVAQYLARRIQIIGPIFGVEAVGIQIRGFGMKGFQSELVRKTKEHAMKWNLFETIANFKRPVTWSSFPLKTSDKARTAAQVAATTDFSVGEAVGLDIGGSSIKAAVIRNGQVIAVRHEKYHSRTVGDTLRYVLHELAATHKIDITRAPVYVGVPSPVLDGKPLNLTNLETDRPGSKASIEDAQWILNGQGVRLVFENDANVGGIYVAVAHQATRGLFVLTAHGTGTGLAIVQEGRLLSAPMELHIPLDYADGVLCGCGAIGCSETLTNVASVARKAEQLAKTHNIELPEGWVLGGHGHVNEPLLLPWLKKTGTPQGVLAQESFRALGVQLARTYFLMAELLNTRELTVAWTGGLSLQNRLIEEGLRRELRRRKTSPSLKITLLENNAVDSEVFTPGPLNTVSSYYHSAVGAALLGLQTAHAAKPSSGSVGSPSDRGEAPPRSQWIPGKWPSLRAWVEPLIPQRVLWRSQERHPHLQLLASA